MINIFRKVFLTKSFKRKYIKNLIFFYVAFKAPLFPDWTITLKAEMLQICFVLTSFTVTLMWLWTYSVRVTCILLVTHILQVIPMLQRSGKTMLINSLVNRQQKSNSLFVNEGHSLRVIDWVLKADSVRRHVLRVRLTNSSPYDLLTPSLEVLPTPFLMTYQPLPFRLTNSPL